jgi:hypothetical protein
MMDGEIRCAQMARNQQSAVAVQRLALGAHEGDAMTRGALAQPVEAVAEGVSRRDLGMADARALAAQLRAKEHIDDAGRAQAFRQRLAVELRIEARIRRRAYIGQRGDPVLAEQIEEALDRMVGMPDGEDVVR